MPGGTRRGSLVGMTIASQPTIDILRPFGRFSIADVPYAGGKGANLERFAALVVAGISIGSNDLTQLLLGADRDSEVVAEVFDERDQACREGA